MKLRVLHNSLNGRQQVALVLGGLAGVGVAIATLLIAVVPFDAPRVTADLLAAVYAGWLTGWVLAPIATGGDDTIRPEFFALLPLNRTRVAAAMLTAGFVGVPALASLIAFAGMIVFGLRLGPAAALVGLLCTFLQLTLVVLLGRITVTGLGALLTSRKGRELGILLAALTGLSGIGLNYAVNRIGPAIVDGRASGLTEVVRALPSGWGVEAVQAAGRGDWGRVALLLGGLGILLALLLAAWGALLARSTTRAPFRGAARARRRAATSKRRTLLPATPTGAVAAKEMRTWSRDARRRITMVYALIVGAIFALMPLIYGSGSSGTAPYLAFYVLAAVCLQTGNLYGFDGSALWHVLVVPGAIPADVRGRQLAWALIVGPPALVLAAVMPGVTGHVEAYPWVLALTPALLGAGTGAVLLQAVFAAYPLPDQRRSTNPLAAGTNPGCSRFLRILATLGVLVLAAIPVVGFELIGVLTDVPALQWASAPLGIAAGALAAWWCGRFAIRRLDEQGPELLQTVSEAV